ncbi:MAG: hypothetical protein M3490_04585 [Chloroflexota bacterium]|jgi:hypothetical protein|nr:hypothetical protein [Chloroflexia bacterium]MDQ3442867.1 hypothetical protein [Chloroflexota bacterium]
MLDEMERRRIQMSTRSQLATELLLTCFALVGSIIILRTMLVMLDISDRIWIGEFIYGLTRPVTQVLSFLPGADREIYRNLTTVDITLLAFLLLFLLGVLATGRSNDSL